VAAAGRPGVRAVAASAAGPEDEPAVAVRHPGALIALEGIDGCGKSTQALLLAAALAGRGFAVGPAAAAGTVVREPGGTALGEGVRDLLLHRDHAVDPWAEALLYAAARAQLAHEVLAPALSDGRVLVLDRYVDSSLAYQGHARGLGIDAVLGLNVRATDGLLPDVSILVALPVYAAAERRGGVRGDRIEAEGSAFQELVAAGYREVAGRFPQRVAIVDGAGDAATVAAAVLSAVEPVLRRLGVTAGERPGPGA
jgi:dTMP kinase